MGLYSIWEADRNQFLVQRHYYGRAFSEAPFRRHKQKETTNPIHCAFSNTESIRPADAYTYVCNPENKIQETKNKGTKTSHSILYQQASTNLVLQCTTLGILVLLVVHWEDCAIDALDCIYR